jgi:hypothetical protein
MEAKMKVLFFDAETGIQAYANSKEELSNGKWYSVEKYHFPVYDNEGSYLGFVHWDQFVYRDQV